MSKSLAKSLAFVLCLVLAGCDLPRGAAQDSEVLAGKDDALPGFAVVPINRQILASVRNWPATGGSSVRDWPRAGGGSAGQIIAIGDMVEISVWDSDLNSLLAPPQQKVASLQTMRVSQSGTIFIPYVGQVEVEGMSPETARESIQSKLSTLVPSAQIQMNVSPGPKNSVSLVGGVNAPGSYPLVSRDMTVLDLISLGGGVPASVNNPQVRMVRGSNYYAVSLERLYSDPGLDATLRTGDKIFIEEDKRYFLSLGAASDENQIPFNRDKISALDAIVLARGFSDNRANLKGILILREYSAEQVVAPGAAGPENTRVIFTLDLTTADGLFSASNFPIMPRDLVLATESPVTNTRTVIGIIGSLVGISVGVDDLNF